MIHESQVSLFGPCFLSWPVGIHSQTNQKYYPVTLLRNNFKNTSQKQKRYILYHFMLHVCTSSQSFSTSYRLPRVELRARPTNRPSRPHCSVNVNKGRGDPSKSAWGSHAERTKTPGFVQKIWLHQTKLVFFHTMKKKTHRSIYIIYTYICILPNNTSNIFRVEQQRRDILIYIFIYPSKECNRRTHVFSALIPFCGVNL